MTTLEVRMLFNRPVLLLGAGFAIILVLMLMLAVFAVTRMYEMHEDVENILDWHNVRVANIFNMRSAVRDRMIAMNRVVMEEDPVSREEAYEQYLGLADSFMVSRAALDEMARSAVEQEQLNGLRRLTATLTPLNDRVIHMARQGRTSAARQLLLSQALPSQQQVLLQLDRILDHYRTAAQEVEAHAHGEYLLAVRMTWGIVGGMLVLSIAIAVFVVRRMQHDRRQLIEAHETQQQLRELTQRDSLSGLLNRQGMNEYLRRSLSEAERDGTMVAVMLLDLDNFKAINDTLGHAAGDELIVSVARRLTDCLHRETDVAARLAGDEFVVILRGLSTREESGIVVRRMMRTLGQPHSLAGREQKVSASIGVAVYPIDARTSSALLHCADTAMYSVKEAGRSGFEYYEQGMAAQKK